MGTWPFLVVALTHVRRQFLANNGCPYPDLPVPRELKKADPDILRKAARMNMVMNNDGHGNIFSFNSLEFGIPRFTSPEQSAFSKKTGGGHGQFDYVFTNPPFGAKIPVEEPEILRAFDLGHSWKRSGDIWIKSDVQKKAPPEILFIEACWKFLKPGTGIMAIVLPNGILGNPGSRWNLSAGGFCGTWNFLLASICQPKHFCPRSRSKRAACSYVDGRKMSIGWAIATAASLPV
jgi:type I restriction enzyme M protein